jgi:hypothetical protein
MASSPFSLSSSPLSLTNWQFLWSLRIQFRLNYLLWKISWNILPVCPNIFRFFPTVDEELLRFPLCSGPPKTLQYIFLGCPFARRLWLNSSWPLITSSLSSQPIANWTKSLLHPCETFEISPKEAHNFQLLVLVLLNHIWLTRNKVIHNGFILDPLVAHLHIRISTIHHVNAWKSSDLLSTDWSPPPLGTLKVNFDVAIRPDFL